jgi:hypothetical protein
MARRNAALCLALFLVALAAIWAFFSVLSHAPAGADSRLTIIHLAFATYTALQVAAAAALALMFIVPGWRDKLWTGPGMAVFILGLFGSVKIVFFGILDLSAWSPAAGVLAFAAVALGVVVGLLIVLARWLRQRLREQRPIRRIAGDVLFFGIPLAAGIALFEWVDYHVKGKSALFGINPRCIDYAVGYCFKLDTANMPWDATAAVWLSQAFWYGAIALAAAGVLVLAFLLLRESFRIVRGRLATRHAWHLRPWSRSKR